MEEKPKRKPISKKLRFEIFKRDSFTCQYCGRMAPEVILEVDHILPVSKGGKNDMLNLVSSCYDCNRGKRDVKLSDNSTILIQQEKLKEINERRNQLKLLMEWKNELTLLEEEQVDFIESVFAETGYHLSFTGREMCKKAINNYGIDEVYESTKISFQKYYKGTKESLESVVDYIFRICAIRKKQTEIPYYKKFQYLKAVINNRAGYQKRNYYLFPVLEKIIKHLYENSIDELEEFEKTVKILNTFTEYEEYFNYLRGEYGI